MSKILVVDDEPTFPKLINGIFKEQVKTKKYEFYFASNGREALNQLQSNPQIEIMLTDIRMPEMDGISLLRQVNQNSIQVKTVIVSAYPNINNFRCVFREGALDFITKPFKREELIRIVEQILLQPNPRKSNQHSRTNTTRKRASASEALRSTQRLSRSQQLDITSKLIENFTIEQIEELKYKLEAQEFLETERQEERDSLEFEAYNQLGLSKEELPLIALEEGYIEERNVKKKLASGEVRSYGIHLYLRWYNNEGKRESYYLGSKESPNEITSFVLAKLGHNLGRRSTKSTTQDDPEVPSSDLKSDKKPSKSSPLRLY